MPGALGLSTMTRRRFDGGGGVSTGRAGDVPAGALNAGYDTNQSDEGPQPQGVLAAANGAPPAVPALNAQSQQQQMAAQEQAAAIQRAHARLVAQNVLRSGGVGAPAGGNMLDIANDPSMLRIPTFTGPGYSNLPMMAAAGAMLEPTRTGGFAESLGRGLQAGAAGAEQQRQLIENAALRAQQQELQNSWHMAQVGVNQQKADTYGEKSAAQIAELREKAALDQARAAHLTAMAALKGASHVTEGDVLNETVNSLVTPDPKTGELPINPMTNKPYTRLEAFQLSRSSWAQMTNASAHQESVDNTKNIREKLYAQTVTRDEWNMIHNMDDEQLKLYAASKGITGVPTLPAPTLRLPSKLPGATAAPDAAGAPGATAAPAAAAAPTATGFEQLPEAAQMQAAKHLASDLKNGLPNAKQMFEQSLGAGAAEKALALLKAAPQ